MSRRRGPGREASRSRETREQRVEMPLRQAPVAEGASQRSARAPSPAPAPEPATAPSADTARPSRELSQKFLNLPYVAVPECESVEEIRGWIDEAGPYKPPYPDSLTACPK